MKTSLKTSFSSSLKVTVCLILAGSLIGLMGCEYLPFGYTPIGDIVKNPASFENKQVKVKGVVSDVTKIPFVDVTFYVLNDGPHRIVVLGKDTIPGPQEKITVVGTVHNVAILGGESIGPHIKEARRASYSF